MPPLFQLDGGTGQLYMHDALIPTLRIGLGLADADSRALQQANRIQQLYARVMREAGQVEQLRAEIDQLRQELDKLKTPKASDPAPAPAASASAKPPAPVATKPAKATRTSGD